MYFFSTTTEALRQERLPSCDWAFSTPYLTVSTEGTIQNERNTRMPWMTIALTVAIVAVVGAVVLGFFQP